MVVIKLMGALGNQLFQYSFYKYVEKYGFYAEFETSWFINGGYQQYVDANRKDYADQVLLDLYDTSYKVKDPKDTRKCPTMVREESFQIDQLKDDTYLWGYWQNVDYILPVRDLLRKEIDLKPQYIDDQMRAVVQKLEGTNSVALHLRYYPIDGYQIECTKEYYSAAVESILEDQKDIELFIFSYDIERAQKEYSGFAGLKTHFIHFEEGYKEMYLMSKAKHNIICNSTFSWWSAFLNMNRDNITVVPNVWWPDKKANLCMPGWRSIGVGCQAVGE